MLAVFSGVDLERTGASISRLVRAIYHRGIGAGENGGAGYGAVLYRESGPVIVQFQLALQLGSGPNPALNGKLRFIPRRIGYKALPLDHLAVCERSTCTICYREIKQSLSGIKPGRVNVAVADYRGVGPSHGIDVLDERQLSNLADGRGIRSQTCEVINQERRQSIE